MCDTICERFCPIEGGVAGYVGRKRAKYTAKWGVQIAGMILGHALVCYTFIKLWLLGFSDTDTEV